MEMFWDETAQALAGVVETAVRYVVGELASLGGPCQRPRAHGPLS